MSESLGTIRGQMILDVKNALNAYTQARQAHISTVTALHTGAGAMMASGAAIAGVGAIMVAGFAQAIGAAAEFERRLDYFTAVSASTQQEYDAIREKALQLGADTIYSANQIAESFIELGKSGVSAGDIIAGIGEGVASLGAAADIPLDAAANIITSAVATFQLGAENAVMVADKLAGAANASIVDVQDLGVSLKYVGGVAASLGVPFTDVNTALAILGENGIKGSTAGTSLRQVLLGLNGSTEKAKNALEQLGIITADGTNKFYNMDGSAKSLAEVFQILQDATAGMSDQQRTATFQQIFATRALPSLIALTREGAAGFEEMAEAINKTTALEVASERLDNLSGDLEILRGNIDTLLISSGSGFQNVARFIVQSVTEIIQAFLDLPAPIQTAITGITASMGGLMVIVGTLGIFAGAILNIIALATQMGPVWAFLGSVLHAVGGAFTFLWALLSKNPLIIIIAAIAALVGTFITLWHTSEAFRGAVQPLFDALVSIFQQLAPIAQMVMTNIAAFLGTIAGAAAGGLTTFVGLLGQVAAVLGGALGTAISVILPPIMTLVQTLMSGLLPVFQAAIPLISAAAAVLGALFSGNFAALPALMQTFADAFMNSVNVIATQLIPMIIQILTSVVTSMIGFLPQLITTGIQLFTGLVQAAATIIPMLVTTVVQMFTTLIVTIIGLLPQIITAVLGMLTGILQTLVAALPMIIQAGIQLFMGIIQALVTIIPMIIQTLVTLIPLLITSIVSAIPLLIEAAIQLFLALVLGLVEAIPEILTALIDGIIQIVQAVVDAIPLLIDAAIQLFLGIILGLAQALPQIITALVEAIPQIITAITDAIPLLIQGAIDLFLGLVTGLAEALPQIIEAVIAAIPQIVNAIIKAVPQLVNAGKELIQGLINGIVSMGGKLWDAAMGVAQKAFNAVKNFFGIASPSKLMHKMGIFWGQGLTGGIYDSIRPAVAAAMALSSALAAVPFEMTGLLETYDAINATKVLAAKVDAATLGVEASTLLALNDRVDGTDGTNINIEKVEINNPEPEPASDSLPSSIRKIAYMGG